MTIKPITVEIVITGDKFSFTFQEDYTDYAADLIECSNVFKDTQILMNAENIYDFFKDGEFESKDIESLNGNHFLFGFLENFGQSDMCPEKLYTYSGELKYKTRLLNT